MGIGGQWDDQGHVRVNPGPRAMIFHLCNFWIVDRLSPMDYGQERFHHFPMNLTDRRTFWKNVLRPWYELMFGARTLEEDY